jgi:hypothetical protein
MLFPREVANRKNRKSSEKGRAMVRMEIWTHVFAYNLIRTVMAQAPAKEAVSPRSITFKTTLRILKDFQPLIAFHSMRATGQQSIGRSSGPSRSTASQTDPTALSLAWRNAGRRGTTARRGNGTKSIVKCPNVLAKTKRHSSIKKL